MSYQLKSKPERLVTFGKYKCQSLSNLLNDINYCTWLIQQDWVHEPKCNTDIFKYLDVRDHVLMRHPHLIDLVPNKNQHNIPETILNLKSNIVQWDSEEELVDTDETVTDTNSDTNSEVDSEADSDADTEVYQVERILGHEQRPDGTYYLIKWDGYDPAFNSYEHEKNITEDILLVYWKQLYSALLASIQSDTLKASDVYTDEEEDEPVIQVVSSRQPEVRRSARLQAKRQRLFD